MLVNDKKRLIYLAHPRTGSRSMKTALNTAWGGFREVGPHHSGPAPSMCEDDWEGYEFFTTVRNHWDAITSWWFNAVGQADDPKLTVPWLRKWMKGNRLYFHPESGVEPEFTSIPRMWWFLDIHPRPHILRFETLTEDFHNFLGSRGFGPTEFPHIGRGNFRDGTHYRDIMSPEVRFFIEETFAEEIEELGYRY